MENIYLTKRYFKKPGYAIAILLSVAFLTLVINWTFSFEKNWRIVSKYGGILGYIYVVLRGGIIPELATLVVILFLIDLVHTLLKIDTIQPSWSAILRYELIFLPVMLLAFFIFNPITQSIRYVLINFPVYNFSTYWTDYVIGTYSVKLYSIYIIPVLLIGYIAINLSLLSDLLSGFKAKKRPK
ncbi:hypothetical protein [Larkinella terrae]|uniref:Uncharacterized protein n=1 Tax=Larkinella terrae TaxID=2025311 RepID=A0A7K0ESD7_9BACT|nr:hypothetical protein [Larkinella terrae]MRS64689.1 hypothetical protein [Larkinella terrae]